MRTAPQQRPVTLSAEQKNLSLFVKFPAVATPAQLWPWGHISHLTWCCLSIRTSPLSPLMSPGCRPAPPTCPTRCCGATGSSTCSPSSTPPPSTRWTTPPSTPSTRLSSRPSARGWRSTSPGAGAGTRTARRRRPRRPRPPAATTPPPRPSTTPGATTHLMYNVNISVFYSTSHYLCMYIVM